MLETQGHKTTVVADGTVLAAKRNVMTWGFIYGIGFTTLLNFWDNCFS
jgi:hypothetical protein